ncbi:MAG: hypothetical protein M0P71_00910 [Melioribacteraceae bacterium]|nr:hypothetical protein [Melioribacteraceae bacterium]
MRIRKDKKIPKSLKRKFLTEKDYDLFLKIKRGLEEVKYGIMKREVQFKDCESQLFSYENHNIYIKEKTSNDAIRIKDGRRIKISDTEKVIELELQFPLIEWLAIQAKCGKILYNIEKRYGTFYEEE